MTKVELHCFINCNIYTFKLMCCYYIDPFHEVKSKREKKKEVRDSHPCIFVSKVYFILGFLL